MKRRIIAWSLFAVVALAIIGGGVAAHALGVSMYVITGGSMTGSISKGSIVFDKTVPVSSLRVGDVITFRPPSMPANVTHRIVDIQKDDTGRPVFKTKGDANEAVDPWQFTLDKSVQAKYAFHMPWVGYVLAAFTLRVVRTVLLVVVGLLIMGFTVSWLRKRPEEDEEDPGCPSDPALDPLCDPAEAK